MNKEEANIIEEILAGRTFRYEYFVKKYSRQVFATIVRMVGNGEDAEELTQDAFMKAFAYLDRFNGKCSFSTWLYRIAYTVAVSSLRKAKIDSIELDDNLLNRISDSYVDEVLNYESDERIERLMAAIDMLACDERMLVTLFYNEEKTVADIAYIMGLSVANVKVRLCRVRKKLCFLMENRL